ERESKAVVLRLRDSGVGIPPDVLPHVFDLFVQADRSLDHAQGGLGIGLTLVRRAGGVDGGTGGGHSGGGGGGGGGRGGRGPAARPPRAAEAEAPAPPPARILIVDDQADIAESLAILLETLGHQTRAAFNGPEALAAAEEFKPDAILLDLGLPGMDGFEVAR